MPSSLRGYAVLVPAQDSLSEQLARAFRRHGVAVQRRIRKGNGPTAAVVHFTFREPGRGAISWLHVRLADTRTGAIVGAATVALDSLPDAGARAAAILDSLGMSRSPARQP